MYTGNSGHRFSERLIRLILSLCLLGGLPAQHTAYARPDNRKFTLVIDAGHGGRDLGATGRRSHEKDITLDIAKRTGRLIRRHCKEVRVIQTRTKDENMSLEDRAGMANFFEADLLLSIHVNSAPTLAKGTETFIHPKTRDGRSRHMARLIQQAYEKEAGRENRGVKTANFAVLRLSRMPSVLTEVGFISHAREEKFIKSRRGKKKLSRCLYRAFRQYKDTYACQGAEKTKAAASLSERVQ